MTPPVVSIVSKKKSGKTTLLEKMIPELIKRGHKVGTVKHDIHGFDMDHKGKDTWRHKQAGASSVLISSPWKLSLIKEVREEMALDALVSTYFTDVDIVLTEGYMKAGKPQIEVFRHAVHDKPLYHEVTDMPLLAFMSDEPLDMGVPCFDINDVKRLVDFIEERFLND